MAERILVQLKDGDGNALYPEIAGECVPDGAVATDKLADGAVTEAKLGAELAKEIASSKTMADTLLEGLEDPAHLEDPFVKAGIIPIPFEDEEVKKVLVENFDKDGDGEISYAEAQAVTEWPVTLFRDNTRIRKFREFRFFGGLQKIQGGNYWGYDTFGAFGGCTNLTDIEFPPGLGSLFPGDYNYAKGEKMFSQCASLALTKLPDDWTELAYGMFRGCTSLKLAYLPSALTGIKEYAFQGCASLALTELPSGVTSIGGGAFQGCASLALTELPSGVTSIGDGAFQGCASLALTKLPDSLTELGRDATFNECTSLALTKLPDWLTEIGSYAFNECTSLALTKLPDWLTEIGFCAFNECTSLALTALPPKLEKIGLHAFYNCGKCSFTSIPETVTEMAEQPFYGCGGVGTIKELSLPALQSVGWQAFSSFTSLESLTLGATPPSGGSFGLAPGCVIYVPDDAVDTYKAATGWADYAGRIKGVSEKSGS